ncbi:uncharacterized protein LOC109861042 [Pseudomyrmex gracilis]|uniref:uncharacterized protein LOC109861042 n=1 Tax=Pseudomyrmex gracilis TaxID=219809 RepID=UPI000995B485|nr:uncharacterized protein LOC109861042 [Pseudomyrmex gracilis]
MRRQINLSDFGITEVRPKRAVTGAFINEILGKNSKARLYAAMSTLADEFGMKGLRIKGLDDSITPDEMRDAVVAIGSCRPTKVKVGQVYASPNKLFTAWVQCPIAAAKKVTDTGFLRVG